MYAIRTRTIRLILCDGRRYVSAIASAISKEEYQKCFRFLGLQETCTQDELREAFLKLAKKHHPDSSHPQADAETFHQVEHSYRILQEKFELEKQLSAVCNRTAEGLDNTDVAASNVVNLEIEHTAPQHRQYLNYEGVGQGSPFQRQKQYHKHQVKKAIENVYSHRVSQIPNVDEHSLVYKDAKASRKTKTKYGIDRLVEDLIQESMSKGEFTNLKGSGKPLQYQNHNPFIDVVTHKINQVLIDYGFSPQWVMLEKEIRSEITRVKGQLKERQAQLGPHPLNQSDHDAWERYLASLADDVKSINKKINDYNLVVPLLQKQMVHVNLNRLSEKCLLEEPCKKSESTATPVASPSDQDRNSTADSNLLFSLFSAVWKRA